MPAAALRITVGTVRQPEEGVDPGSVSALSVVHAITDAVLDKVGPGKETRARDLMWICLWLRSCMGCH